MTKNKKLLEYKPYIPNDIVVYYYFPSKPKFIKGTFVVNKKGIHFEIS